MIRNFGYVYFLIKKMVFMNNTQKKFYISWTNSCVFTDIKNNYL
jgi:hypothetical protein